MVCIYQIEEIQEGAAYYGRRGQLFRFYDTDEVPDDLSERVQRWANTYDCIFEIDSIQTNEASVTTIYPNRN